MELWIPITVAAAFFQTVRLMLQKQARGTLSTMGATFARFVWAAPLATTLAAILVSRAGNMPEIGAAFWGWAVVGGIAQILATALLVSLFSLRNFAVGVAFSKTETVQTFLFGIVILSEAVSGTGLLAILISFVGVLLISAPGTGYSFADVSRRAVAYGIGSGALFGISAISYRAGSLAVESDDFLMRATITLAFVTVLQTVLMWVWLGLREPGEVGRVLKGWRQTALVGLTGMLGSLGWFSAMTLQNAAYVRALGQVELVFTFAVSYLVFGERSTMREVLGVLLIVGGIVVLLIGT